MKYVLWYDNGLKAGFIRRSKSGLPKQVTQKLAYAFSSDILTMMSLRGTLAISGTATILAVIE